MNSCFQYQNKNSMQKKGLRTNQAGVRIAEELANNNAMVTVAVVLVTEKSVKCLKPFVPLVAKTQPYLLSLRVKDQFIAGIVSRPDAIGN